MKRLDTQLDEPTDQISSPKVVKPTNMKRYYKTLETSVINSLMSLSSLEINTVFQNRSAVTCAQETVMQREKERELKREKVRDKERNH